MLRQLLIESALLAGLGVAVGLVLAAASFGYLTRLLPADLPASSTLALDWRVLALTSASRSRPCCCSAPGPPLRRHAATSVPRLAERSACRASGPGACARALVVAEIALTVVLLAGAGLLLRSYRAVLAVDPGFDAAGLVVLNTVLPQSRYRDGAAREAFYQRVLERVRALPGVESAGYTNFAPLVVKGGSSVTFVEGRPRPEPAEMSRTLASDRSVSPGYLETLGVPLLRGRFIDERDTRSAPRWPSSTRPWRRVIGRARNRSVSASRWAPAATGCSRSSASSATCAPRAWTCPPARSCTCRTTKSTYSSCGRPTSWCARPATRWHSFRRCVARSRRSTPTQPVSNVRAMTEVVDAELANRNTQLTLIGGFALLALVLAAVGLYGTLSYTVAQSTNEIGLRMALGAGQSTVVGAVVRSALGAAVVGIAVGLFAAFVLTRTIASFLYGVSPRIRRQRSASWVCCSP